ncbi:beta-lactamase class A [Arthrobacter pigmenti]|uniref:Beta-lactamase class A n=1 Tax=Arthrobacter pigmenti TaxID=271432 RepID=A0A846REJ2_9MICC|nr:serine hydrolase [Arthrobacter pigmenti]NJC21558.1 beta-lactamase class A [Arthrobacter pigmenti]
MSVTSDYSDGVPHISFHLTTLGGKTLAEREADTVVYAASTIKLAVLVAALREVDAGRLSLDQPVTVRISFPSAAPGAGTFTCEPGEIDEGLPAVGRNMPLREVLGRMITVSSNEATNMAVDLVGLPSVNTALEVCGAASSKMERLFGDLAGLEAGLTQETTATDLATIVCAIVSGRAAGPESTRLMLEFLRAQEYGIIGPVLPAGADWGSKSGWVTGIRHDVAFVRPDGSDDGYVLAVCTRACEEESATAAITALSTMAWDLWEAR